ncbi:hypothetical protein ACWKSP_22240 [Micromonosporaceae bacterium Da 78-11]
MATLTNDIAAIIREVDGDNQLTPMQLGYRIVVNLPQPPEFGGDLIRFVERTNPDKKMGAGRLAELLVAEFDLDKE